jgi:A/G-specific adenine glycosylase
MLQYESELEISRILVEWYETYKRELPWRETRDPYIIWISEIILQQTRVVQGLEYFLRFTERFPDVASLAAAEEDEVLKYWQGLGYYSRARNLHAAAKSIMERFNGVFPENYKEVLSLKGIGEYTAAAIVSFAWNQPCPVVDGNVYRVLSRLFAVRTVSPLTPIPAMLMMKSTLSFAPSINAIEPPSLWPSTPTLPNFFVDFR